MNKSLSFVLLGALFLVAAHAEDTFKSKLEDLDVSSEDDVEDLEEGDLIELIKLAYKGFRSCNSDKLMYKAKAVTAAMNAKKASKALCDCRSFSKAATKGVNRCNCCNMDRMTSVCNRARDPWSWTCRKHTLVSESSLGPDGNIDIPNDYGMAGNGMGPMGYWDMDEARLIRKWMKYADKEEIPDWMKRRSQWCPNPDMMPGMGMGMGQGGMGMSGGMGQGQGQGKGMGMSGAAGIAPGAPTGGRPSPPPPPPPPGTKPMRPAPPTTMPATPMFTATMVAQLKASLVTIIQSQASMALLSAATATGLVARINAAGKAQNMGLYNLSQWVASKVGPNGTGQFSEQDLVAAYTRAMSAAAATTTTTATAAAATPPASRRAAAPLP